MNDPFHPPHNPGKGSSGMGLAIVSMAAALAGMASVQLVLQTPSSHERLAALWPGASSSTTLSPIRTVSAEIRDSVGSATPEGLPTALFVQNEAGERDVTGSIPPTVLPDGPTMVSTKSSFGADIGGSGNIRDIRALWANVQPGLSVRGHALEPLLVFQDGTPMQQLRLVVGPVSNAADIALLCAMMPASVQSCSLAPYQGQKLPAN